MPIITYYTVQVVPCDEKTAQKYQRMGVYDQKNNIFVSDRYSLTSYQEIKLQTEDLALSAISMMTPKLLQYGDNASLYLTKVRRYCTEITYKRTCLEIVEHSKRISEDCRKQTDRMLPEQIINLFRE